MVRGVKNFLLVMFICFTFFCMHNYNGKLKKLARANRRAGNLSEALLWCELKNGKLGVSFTKQKPIGNYIADFYCAEKNMVIEIDGWSHDNKYEYDKVRDEYMKTLGIHVLRISDIDVKRDMSGTLDWIKINLDMLYPPPPASAALPQWGRIRTRRGLTFSPSGGVPPKHHN